MIAYLHNQEKESVSRGEGQILLYNMERVAPPLAMHSKPPQKSKKVVQDTSNEILSA
jgi:hypothetical protein